MDSRLVEQWLMNHRSSLTDAYLSLLKNADPDTKDFFLQQLGTMLGPILNHSKEVQQAINREK